MHRALAEPLLWFIDKITTSRTWVADGENELSQRPRQDPLAQE